jgi:hypothetical protein
MSEKIIPTFEKELHPCQYCDTDCYGKQCKSCHLNMIKARTGTCSDCEKDFVALRKDGSYRKRCFDCQTLYNKKYIATCPICKNDYHAYLDDGRVFDRCYQCYTRTFHKCENCDNKTKEEFSLCKTCYELEKATKNTYLNENHLLLKCKTEGCEALSRYSLCKQCYENQKEFQLYSIPLDESD